MSIQAFFAMLLAFIFGITPQSALPQETGGRSFWDGSGTRIFLSDNGTPGNYDDDFVADWENNREAEVFVFDD